MIVDTFAACHKVVGLRSWGNWRCSLWLVHTTKIISNTFYPNQADLRGDLSTFTWILTFQFGVYVSDHIQDIPVYMIMTVWGFPQHISHLQYFCVTREQLETWIRCLHATVSQFLSGDKCSIPRLLKTRIWCLHHFGILKKPQIQPGCKCAHCM